jgi:hypothetical protein
MLGRTWYFGSIRKYVTIFGSLFNDISINRVDSDDKTVKTIKVPISYGPKERYLTREEQNPDLLRPISMVYPRMAFEITSVTYDSSRKLNPIGKCTSGSSSSGTLKTQYNPAPYNIGFSLSIIARNSDDALRIVEQILPFFNPSINVTANLIPEMNYDPVTIPISLEAVQQGEAYTGPFESQEFVIWNLYFNLKGYIYGPIQDSKVIKEIFVNFYTPSGDLNAANMEAATIQEHIYIRPGLTANGEPTSNTSDSVAISQIDSTDAYGFIINYVRDADE